MHRKRQSKAGAFFRLTRIEHSAMLVIAVLAAETIVNGGFPSLYLMLASFIAPIFVSMGSFAINDYYDVEVDKANGKLKRPLVSGALDRESAFRIAITCFVVGVASATFINAVAFLIALVFAAFAFLYSYRLKEMLLIGNVYVAASMMIPFLFGNFVVSGTLSPTILLLSVTVLASGFAREVHGTIRDYNGDREVRNVISIPSKMGTIGAAALAFSFYLIAIALSVWLFFFPYPFHYNLFYIASIAVVDAMLVYVSVGYLHKRRGRSQASMFSRTRNVSLLAMGLALLIYLLSTVIVI